MAISARRRALADALGLGALLLVLLDLLRPSLLLLPTIAAGGDMPCHFPTAAWFCERLLPELRLHGWYPGAYLGHPLLLYYFPFPFLVMAALAPAFGLPVAFKLGTVGGVFLLPLLSYLSFRLMRLAFPAPLLAAAAALVFLYVEDNPIWGGTITSTLAGEFSYTYGAGFAVLFVGVLVRARQDGRGPWLAGAALALTAYAHGYAVLWAGLTAAGLLVAEPSRRRLLWLASVAAVAAALAAPSLVPLLADWGWTTPYDDAWIDVTTRGVFPALLRPLFAIGAAGAIAILARRALGARADARPLVWAFGALAGLALAAAGPRLGVIDVRFLPLAQLALALCGAALVGAALGALALCDLAALGLLLVAVVAADNRSRVLRSWVDWNYSGLEAKELWPAWSALNERLRAAGDDARVAVEYGPIHERAGSIRMYETLPYFSGRPTLEGVYNQAATNTHPVYYLASELFARSPNPFRSRRYSSFDPESALPRLRLFNVSELVAVSRELEAALDTRPDVRREASLPPYTLYRLSDPGPGYVEPLAFAPLRAPLRDWRDASYRWMSRKPANRALLVFTDDPRFEPAVDTWTPPPERPLESGVRVQARVAPEAVLIETSRPGHPLLVKVAYHPRWRAAGALGPYLVSPGLMLVVPTQERVSLRYAARTWADHLGSACFLATLALAAVAWVRRRSGPSVDRARVVETRAEEPAIVHHVLRALPLTALAALALLRVAPDRRARPDVGWLDEQASRAYAAERFEDAAEYARHALDAAADADARRGELACLRGESLLRAGHARLAGLAFAPVVEAGSGPYRPQALFSGALARERAGDAAGAEAWRTLLRAEYPRTPWAEKLQTEPPPAGPVSVPPAPSLPRSGSPPSPGPRPR
jgi:hypothetical protein